MPSTNPQTGDRDPRLLVNMAHRFRDQVLARSAVGMELAQIYYQFSDEAVRLAAKHPAVLVETSEFLLRFAPNLEELVETGRTRVSEWDLQVVDGLLATYQRRAGEAMAEAVASVRKILRNPKAQALMGVTVGARPKPPRDSGYIQKGIKCIYGKNR